MRSDATSEARVRGEAPQACNQDGSTEKNRGGGPQALPVEGALSPYNCGEHARGKDGAAARWGKGTLVRFLSL